jgi:flavin reductase (DIM6/NTAB) family NADH-FMN oxidoreductase RutF
MFASTGRKHSVSNIEATGEFVCSLATWDIRDAMNASSAALPAGQSEFEAAGLMEASSLLVKPPRVAGAAAALECRLLKLDPIAGLNGEFSGSIVVYGEVVGIYIDDRFIVDGRFDMAAARTIARCGYMDYAVVDSVFQLDRPRGKD